MLQSTPTSHCRRESETFFGLSRPQLIGALTQLTGENHTGAQQAGFQVMDRFLRLLVDPFAATRADGGAGSAIGFAPERSAAFPADVALAYASVLKAPPRRRSPRSPPAHGTSGPRATAVTPISAAIR